MIREYARELVVAGVMVAAVWGLAIYGAYCLVHR